MREFLKHTFSSLAFIAGLLILLIFASQLVLPKDNLNKKEIHDSGANGILAEAENTIDVLILGDSECYSSVIPLQIWKDYGITSYLCSTPAQKIYYTDEFLQKTFEKQKPKIVMLETNLIFRTYSNQDAIKNKIERILPVFRYHNRWKSLTGGDFKFSAETKYKYREINKGYYYSKVSNPASAENYMTPSNAVAPISSRNKRYVESIINFCRKNNAELILYSTPSTKNWNYMRHNAIKKLADELKVEYIDVNLLQNEVPIDWKKDSRDKGDHLNYYGAVKMSNYLGKYFFDKSIFVDHRDDVGYKSWNDASKKFYDNLKSQGIKE
ncbi:MAG: hypothetical protein ACLVKR_02045 [Lachnospiraceae bacterium]